MARLSKYFDAKEFPSSLANEIRLEIIIEVVVREEHNDSIDSKVNTSISPELLLRLVTPKPRAMQERFSR